MTHTTLTSETTPQPEASTFADTVYLLVSPLTRVGLSDTAALAVAGVLCWLLFAAAAVALHYV